LDLQTAARRYEEMRRFWAREIALTLMQRGARSQIAALRALAANGGHARGRALFTPSNGTYANAHAWDTSATQMCRALFRSGLLTRQRHSLGEHSRPFFYTLTELGRLVLNYIPDDYAAGGEKIPAEAINVEEEKIPAEAIRKKRGRPRKTLVAAPGV
jgi:hypothetical protein